MSNSHEILGRLIQRLSCLDERQLQHVERAVENLVRIRNSNKDSKAAAALPHSIVSKDWPHAPVHRLDGKGAFIVTAATLYKQHLFRDAESLDFLQAMLLAKAKEYDWRIEAWAVFSNHYHFVGQAMRDAGTLSPMIQSLHSETASWLNQKHQQPERQVWHNFWETKLTYEKSYFARLHYVHRNAVHHGLVQIPNQYCWCSAAWFERTAKLAQVKTIYGFKTDRLNVLDDFEPLDIMECGSAAAALE